MQDELKKVVAKWNKLDERLERVTAIINRNQRLSKMEWDLQRKKQDEVAAPFEKRRAALYKVELRYLKEKENILRDLRDIGENKIKKLIGCRARI